MNTGAASTCSWCDNRCVSSNVECSPNSKITTGSSSKCSSPNAGLIAGLVVGGVVILVVIGLIWYCRRRQQRRAEERRLNEERQRRARNSDSGSEFERDNRRKSRPASGGDAKAQAARAILQDEDRLKILTKRAFKKADADNNGTLDRDEVREACDYVCKKAGIPPFTGSEFKQVRPRSSAGSA